MPLYAGVDTQRFPPEYGWLRDLVREALSERSEVWDVYYETSDYGATHMLALRPRVELPEGPPRFALVFKAEMLGGFWVHVDWNDWPKEKREKKVGGTLRYIFGQLDAWMAGEEVHDG